MFGSLRSRLLLILLGATLPAVLVVCFVAFEAYDQTRARAREDIVNDTATLALRLGAIPLGAERLATTIATLGRWSDRAACDRQLASVRAGLERFTDPTRYAGIAVLTPDGVLCEAVSGDDDPPSRVVANAALDLAQIGSGVVRLGSQSRGPRALLWVAARGAADSNPDRAVLLVIDSASLQHLLADYRSAQPGTAMLLDSSGRGINPEGRAAAAMWPVRDVPLGPEPQEAVRPGAGGGATIYAAAKLRGVELWLGTTQVESDVLRGPLQLLILTTAAPLILLLLAGSAIWLGLNGAVLRWVARLRDAARAYAAGDFSVRVGDTSQASREFKELATSFDLLAGHVASHTQALEREVTARAGYIRELHHRVKNILQVIGSLISLQKREVGPEARAVLRPPEDRVNAISAAFRASYAVSELGRAPLGSLVRELVHRLQGTGDGRPADFAVEVVGDDVEIDLDTAISVAMLLAELLPAFVDGGSASGLPIRVTIATTDSVADVAIRGAVDRTRPAAPLSRRFTQAYLRQLNATLDTAPPDETRLRVALAR